LCETACRTSNTPAAAIGEPGVELWIGEARIDLLVEDVDDLGRNIARRAEAVPCARLVARQEIANRRQVRQHRRARRRRHGERAKSARPDELDALGIVSNITCIWPPTRSRSASAPPR